jgi:hypothetical protein
MYQVHKGIQMKFMSARSINHLKLYILIIMVLKVTPVIERHSLNEITRHKSLHSLYMIRLHYIFI